MLSGILLTSMHTDIRLSIFFKWRTRSIVIRLLGGAGEGGECFVEIRHGTNGFAFTGEFSRSPSNATRLFFAWKRERNEGTFETNGETFERSGKISSKGSLRRDAFALKWRRMVGFAPFSRSCPRKPSRDRHWGMLELGGGQWTGG